MSKLIDEYKCDFCYKEFSVKTSLLHHQRTAKYCLEKRNISNDEFKCTFCDKILSTKPRLMTHLELCPKKEIKCIEEIYQQKIKEKEEIYRQKLKERDEFYKEYISKLEQLLITANNTIADIAKQPKTTTTNNNIKGNQTIQNVLCDYKTYEEYTDKDRIISIAKSNDMEKYFWNGQKGIAKFCVDHIAKTKDGKMLICCTDPSRKRFKYYTEKDQVKEDIDARNFTKKISEPIKEVCKEVFDNIQKNIEDQINSDQSEYDSDFLSIKRGMAHERYIEIRNIDDNNNNSDYKKEISILLNI